MQRFHNLSVAPYYEHPCMRAGCIILLAAFTFIQCVQTMLSIEPPQPMVSQHNLAQTHIDCDAAFQNFVNQFNKSYDGESIKEERENFCQNDVTMLEGIRKGKFPHCGLTGIMDKKFSSLITPNLAEDRKRVVIGDVEKLSRPTDYQKRIRALKFYWDPDLQYYSSLDLRDLDLQGKVKEQDGCGSCWAFGVTAVLEGLILRDQNQGLAQERPRWRYNYYNCSLSEQFIASNIWYAADYCNGGNFITAIDYMTQFFKTVETTQNFPNQFGKYYHNWTMGMELKPKLAQSDYYIPFSTYTWKNYQYALIQIYDSERPIGTDPRARNAVMQLLSRGIPVSGAAHVTPYLSAYKGGGIPHEGCRNPATINHQITFVGYGKKKGVDVWVIRNSWGENWGDKGYFFVERGKNSYCTEVYFYTVFPRYQGDRQDRLVEPDKRGIQPWNLDYEKPHLVDPDPNTNDKSGFALSYALVIGSALAAVFASAIIAVAIAFISRRKKHVYKTNQEQVCALE